MEQREQEHSPHRIQGSTSSLDFKQPLAKVRQSIVLAEMPPLGNRVHRKKGSHDRHKTSIVVVQPLAINEYISPRIGLADNMNKLLDHKKKNPK